MPKVTIEHVAQLAGVSTKTVSRVVNREPHVREVTRTKVETAIAELNYMPNPSARNLASQRARLIGLIYDDPSAYEIPSAGYVIRMQQGTLRACRKADYELLIHPCNYRSRHSGGEIADLIAHTRPAGIVLAAPLSNMPRIVAAVEATGTRIVKISPGRCNAKHPSVATNDRQASAEMTRYLASLGHCRIAFITGHRSHAAVSNRFAGFKDGMDQCSLKVFDRLVVAGDNSYGSGEAAASRLLNRKRRPTAIFAANDDMAAATIHMAASLGIHVPGELSVAGFDDIALARQIYPKLTTIRQPLSAMAEQAATMLIERSSDAAATDIVPAVLQIRDSTGPAPD